MTLIEIHGKHKELFAGRSPSWISGFIYGFLFFQRKESLRHLKDYRDIMTQLNEAEKMGFTIPESSVDEWWEIAK